MTNEELLEEVSDYKYAFSISIPATIHTSVDVCFESAEEYEDFLNLDDDERREYVHENNCSDECMIEDIQEDDYLVENVYITVND